MRSIGGEDISVNQEKIKSRGKKQTMMFQKGAFAWRLIFLVPAAILFFPVTAYAYLDPGSGSYLFMILAAGILTLGFWIKSLFKILKDFFRNLFRKKPPKNNGG